MCGHRPHCPPGSCPLTPCCARRSPGLWFKCGFSGSGAGLGPALFNERWLMPELARGPHSGQQRPRNCQTIVHSFLSASLGAGMGPAHSGLPVNVYGMPVQVAVRWWRLVACLSCQLGPALCVRMEGTPPSGVRILLSPWLGGENAEAQWGLISLCLVPGPSFCLSSLPTGAPGPGVGPDSAPAPLSGSYLTFPSWFPYP